ncbi:phosphate acyltransferase PlsX [Helicobacter sp. T3_23-1059]
MRVAIDVMGADKGVQPIVLGALDAIKKREFEAILVGDESQISPLISPLSNELKSRVKIKHCADYIRMEESATEALKRNESSIFVATELVKNGEADALVSPGHSGATMSLATMRIGRIKGISRPAICTLMPTTTDKPSMILDAGANTDCKSEYLLEFAIMGNEYATSVMGYENVRVGLLANGEEESKGNELTKGAFKLLKNYPFFIGNVESGDIFNGSTDVIVCDGFSGNLVLKAAEGVASAVSKILKDDIKTSPIKILGGIILKGSFNVLKKKLDYAEYGGAPLLGVNKVVIISHGKSNERAIECAVYQALKALESKVCERIEKAFVDFAKK